MGFVRNNTLAVASISPHTSLKNKGISSLMQDDWGPFHHIGGLSGIPFSGRKGWKMAVDRVPEDGNLLLLYAPRVQVSKNGEIGRHGVNVTNIYKDN